MVRHLNTEAVFQERVIAYAERFGWQTMHVKPAIIRKGRNGGPDKWITPTSVNGWPDLVLWSPFGFLFMEIKTDKGVLSAAQKALHKSLRQAGGVVFVVRPSNWNDIKPFLENPNRSAA